MKTRIGERLRKVRRAVGLPADGRSAARREAGRQGDAATAPEPRVLFVCTANVCRSPMAASIFNALARDRGLPLRAESAGVSALRREAMAPNAVAALEEIGVSAEPHRARQVKKEMIGASDLVLAMSPKHLPELRRLSRRDDILTLPEYVTGVPDEEGIPDPYGGPITSYRATVRQLLEYVEILVDRRGPWAAHASQKDAGDN